MACLPRNPPGSPLASRDATLARLYPRRGQVHAKSYRPGPRSSLRPGVPSGAGRHLADLDAKQLDRSGRLHILCSGGGRLLAVAYDEAQSFAARRRSEEVGAHEAGLLLQKWNHLGCQLPPPLLDRPPLGQLYSHHDRKHCHPPTLTTSGRTVYRVGGGHRAAAAMGDRRWAAMALGSPDQSQAPASEANLSARLAALYAVRSWG